MAADLVAAETRLWAAADQLWANTGLRPADFSEPVLGLIFLRYADKRFEEVRTALLAKDFDADELEPHDFQDWREKQQARAGVIQTIKVSLRTLPASFTRDVREEKQARAYAHAYDHYFGAGQSVYANAA